MKKFLTVLLVIAVMFTFSFSSAFAASITETAEGYVDAAYTRALTDLKTVYDTALVELDDTTVTYGAVAVSVDEEALETVAAKVYADYQKVLADQYRQIKADTEYEWATVTSVATGLTALNNKTAEAAYVGATLAGAKISDVENVTKFVKVVKGEDATPVYKFDLLKEQLTLTKAKVTGELAKVDLAAYSDKVVSTADPFKLTYKQAAEKTVNTLKDAVSEIKIDEDATQADAAYKVQNLASLLGTAAVSGDDFTFTAGTAAWFNNGVNLKPSAAYKTTSNAVVVTAYVLSGATYEGKAITTAVEQGNSAADLAAKKASAKAKVEATAAAAYQTAYNAYKSAGYTAAAKETFEAEQKKIEAFKTVVNYGIDEATTESVIDVWKAFNTNSRNWLARVDEYARLEALAATAKVTTNKLGELVYDSDAIDANMEDLKYDVYSNGSMTNTLADVVANAEVTTEDVDWAKAVAKARVEDAREAKLYAADGTEIYYAPEAEKVNALYDEYIAKIDACTTVDQVEKVAPAAAPVPVTVPVTVLTKEAIQNDFVNKLGGTALETELAKANTYLAYLNNGLLPSNDGYRTISPADLKAMMAKVYGEAGARTATEAKAQINAVYAALDALPTNAQVAEKVAAVEAAIKALPTNITVADKEAVRAAYKAYDDLTTAEAAKVKTSVKNTLDNAKAALQNLDKKAIDDAMKALPAVAKVTLADKAAVKAIADLIGAYDDEEMYNADYTGDIAPYVAAVYAAEKAAIEKQIYELGENPTEAAVKAAREAYDAFVAEWKSAEAPVRDAKIANIDRLLFAEAQFVMSEEEAKAYVQDLSIKARSVKTSKGVKVTINADVQKLLDNGYTVEYKFYRSTKSNKNFGKAMITKTEGTYTNTKGVKGPKYYYKAKLGVKNAEGEVVATTPLTQCLYATRTF